MQFDTRYINDDARRKLTHLKKSQRRELNDADGCRVRDGEVEDDADSGRMEGRCEIECYQSWYCQRQCKRMKSADGAVSEYELGVRREEEKSTEHERYRRGLGVGYLRRVTRREGAILSSQRTFCVVAASPAIATSLFLLWRCWRKSLGVQ